MLSFFVFISVGRLQSVSWRVDYTLSSSELREVNEPMIQLKLQTQGAESGSTETTVVSVSADKFRVLLAGQLCNLQSHCWSQFVARFSIRNSIVLTVVYASLPQSWNKPRLWWTHYNEESLWRCLSVKKLQTLPKCHAACFPLCISSFSVVMLKVDSLTARFAVFSVIIVIINGNVSSY